MSTFSCALCKWSCVQHLHEFHYFLISTDDHPSGHLPSPGRRLQIVQRSFDIERFLWDSHTKDHLRSKWRWRQCFPGNCGDVLVWLGAFYLIKEQFTILIMHVTIICSLKSIRLLHDSICMVSSCFNGSFATDCPFQDASFDHKPSQVPFQVEGKSLLVVVVNSRLPLPSTHSSATSRRRPSSPRALSFTSRWRSPLISERFSQLAQVISSSWLLVDLIMFIHEKQLTASFSFVVLE